MLATPASNSQTATAQRTDKHRHTRFEKITGFKTNAKTLRGLLLEERGDIGENKNGTYGTFSFLVTGSSL